MSMIATMFDSFGTAYRAKTQRDARQGTVLALDSANRITLKANFPCGVQEASFSEKMLYGQRNSGIVVTIYTDMDIGAEVSDLIVATSGDTGVAQNYLVEAPTHPTGNAKTPWETHCTFIRQPGTAVATLTQGVPN